MVKRSHVAREAGSSLYETPKSPYGDNTNCDCTDKYGWEASAALLTTAIIMTCVLRFFDIRYFRYVLLLL